MYIYLLKYLYDIEENPAYRKSLITNKFFLIASTSENCLKEIAIPTNLLTLKFVIIIKIAVNSVK